MNYKIIGKYIKDLSFSIPNSKTFFLLSKEISKYKINIDIKSDQIKKNIVEVTTSLKLIPIDENFERIDARVEFTTIVEFGEMLPKKGELEEIILIKVPNEIYDELRKIFISLFENSGFKDIKLGEKVNFEELFKSRKTQ